MIVYIWSSFADQRLGELTSFFFYHSVDVYIILSEVYIVNHIYDLMHMNVSILTYICAYTGLTDQHTCILAV